LELGGGFDLPDRGTAKNRNLNVNRDQRSKSEVENDDEGRGQLGKKGSKKAPSFAAKEPDCLGNILFPYSDRQTIRIFEASGEDNYSAYSCKEPLDAP
jgi:hypothetical protein